MKLEREEACTRFRPSLAKAVSGLVLIKKKNQTGLIPSIVQARLVGLAHFSVGYIFTYVAFLIASTSGKFESALISGLRCSNYPTGFAEQAESQDFWKKHFPQHSTIIIGDVERKLKEMCTNKKRKRSQSVSCDVNMEKIKLAMLLCIFVDLFQGDKSTSGIDLFFLDIGVRMSAIANVFARHREHDVQGVPRIFHWKLFGNQNNLHRAKEIEEFELLYQIFELCLRAMRQNIVDDDKQQFFVIIQLGWLEMNTVKINTM
ncbi:protein of unknown function DUF1985, partial [Cynara cardunculus var. scolymus]